MVVYVLSYAINVNLRLVDVHESRGIPKLSKNDFKGTINM